MYFCLDSTDQKTIQMIEVEIYNEEDIIKSADAEYIYVSSWIDFSVDLSINLKKGRGRV